MTLEWTAGAMLALGVLAAWMGSLIFLRRAEPAEWLYRPAILAATAGTALVLAGLIAEGPTVRVGKLALLEAVLLATAIILASALSRAAKRRAKSLYRAAEKTALPVRRR